MVDEGRSPRPYPLGRNQTRVLGLVRDRKGWKPGCGWVWGTSYETDRMLRSLERRGHVKRTGEDPGTGLGHYEAMEAP